MLELRDVHFYYGGVHALKGISLALHPGEIVTVIGANGAGKSTTLRLISGLLKPRSGKVIYSGSDITGLEPEKVAALGISHCPEGRQVFGRLTVIQNLLIGAYLQKNRNEIQRELDRVFDIFPVLKERRRQYAGTLSGGEQEMLALGRALMSRPRLLLLDEPSLGLAPMMVEAIFSTIASINKEGTTILLVEQNASMALEVAHRGYVMETGQVLLEGDSVQLLANDGVKRAYLGG
ncbi:MAG TPA: ABC transporter ATP-binding protein [Firmicutes bacterium]|nr:ABC transporter ATP-binding protein [Bacillota bacterium]